VSALVPVLTAAEAASLDAAVIASGVASASLMARAGAAAAAVIADRYPHYAAGVTIFTGPGNNGGDGWVVAGALAAAGTPVSVVEVLPSKTDDAIAVRNRVSSLVNVATLDQVSSGRAVIVDALLGTGSDRAPQGPLADAIAVIARMRAGGSRVVSLDLPSGVNATSGDFPGSVTADLTISFGSIKRGHLIARDRCGAIAVVDIGLEPDARELANVARLVDASWVAERIPPIPSNAHKGTRRRITIVGGAEGMAGATILAAQSALRSGAGLVRVVVHPSNVDVVHRAIPAALVAKWPQETEAEALATWGDALLIGPGLGTGEGARKLVEEMLGAAARRAVIDADGLNVFQGDLHGLSQTLGGRPAVLTPHPGEFSRLVNGSIDEVDEGRFDVGRVVADATRATVLLKGVPTVITAPGKSPYVCARGTAALATGGSGDVLGGMIVTLLAQTGDPTVAATCAAWVHGYASELAAGAQVRGTTLADVIDHLRDAWSIPSVTAKYPIIAELPAPPGHTPQSA
jgi:ADP-dependent NAD(P)H-hydrate dehydratase / NAD(P)H-hydrate epimerase